LLLFLALSHPHMTALHKSAELQQRGMHAIGGDMRK